MNINSINSTNNNRKNIAFKQKWVTRGNYSEICDLAKKLTAYADSNKLSFRIATDTNAATDNGKFLFSLGNDADKLNEYDYIMNGHSEKGYFKDIFLDLSSKKIRRLFGITKNDRKNAKEMLDAMEKGTFNYQA